MPADCLPLPEIEQRLGAAFPGEEAIDTWMPRWGIRSRKQRADFYQRLRKGAVAALAREVARMLAEQREACVLAICWWCREALAGEAPSAVEQKSGQWVHVYGEDNWWTCAANAIRSVRWRT